MTIIDNKDIIDVVENYENEIYELTEMEEQLLEAVYTELENDENLLNSGYLNVDKIIIKHCINRKDLTKEDKTKIIDHLGSMATDEYCISNNYHISYMIATANTNVKLAQDIYEVATGPSNIAAADESTADMYIQIANNFNSFDAIEEPKTR